MSDFLDSERPSLEIVAKHWETMAIQLANFGCAFRLEVSGGLWCCTIFDPNLHGGSNAARKPNKEDAIREAVAGWEALWKERRAEWPDGPQ